MQRGSLNVVVQPGLWRVPRVDHLGVVLDDEEAFDAVLERAASWNLPVQDRSSRRTFVSTGAGYRIEVHPPRPWIDDLLAERDELAVADLQPAHERAAPEGAAPSPTSSAWMTRAAAPVEVGETRVQFLPGGPEGRPELYAERFAEG